MSEPNNTLTICVCGTRTLGYEIDKKTGYWVKKRFSSLEVDIDQNLYHLFYDVLDHFKLDLSTHPVKIIHSGYPYGVDKIADDYFRSEWSESQVQIEMFPAKWKEDGEIAGKSRNQDMALIADALILIWNGKSPESKHIKAEFARLDKPIFEKIIERK